ncbi:hypothetical protein KJ940_17485 [Myxococcota bacterium]|nr:hypothetical protein [Myxococcota bacterium]
MNSSRFPGAAVGLVTNLNDPEQQGRVKVRFPWLDDTQESFWCRVSATQAGKSRGNFIRPELGDEVLVLFERGDLHQPFIIGSLWNGQDAPPGPGNPDGKNDDKFFQSRSGHQLVFNDNSGGGSIQIHDSKAKLHTELDVPGQHIRLTADSGTINLRAPAGAVKMECVDLLIHSTKDTTIQAGGGNSVEVKGSRSYTAPSLTQSAGETLSITTPNLNVSCAVYSQVSGGTGVSFGSASAELSGGVEMEYNAPVTRTVTGKSTVKAKSFRTEQGGPSGPLNLNCGELSLTSRGATAMNAGGPIALQAAKVAIKAGTMLLGKDKDKGQSSDPMELLELVGGLVMLNPGMSTFSVTRSLDLIVGADFHNAAPTPATGGAPFPYMPHMFTNPIIVDTKPTVLVAGAPLACIGSAAVGVHMPVTPAPWAPIPITFRGLLTQAITAATLPSVMSAGEQVLALVRPNMAKADREALVTKGVEKLAGLAVDEGIEAAERYFTRAFPEFQNYGAFIGILMQLMPYPVANGSMSIGAHNVLAEDAPMSMGTMPFANSCSDVPIVPNAAAISIAPVQVGIDMSSILEQMVTQAVVGAVSMGVGKAADKLSEKLPVRIEAGVTPKFNNNRFELDFELGLSVPRVRQADCDAEGHPVDPVTGVLFDKQLDLELPGLLPLRIERNHNSMALLERWGGVCGLGWRLNIEPYMTLHLDGEGRKAKAYWLLHDDELRMQRLPWLEALGAWHELPKDRLEFCRADERLWDLRDRHGVTWRFEQPTEDHAEARLQRYFDRHDNAIVLHYDGDDARHPSGLTDTLGRRIKLRYEGRGLLTTLSLMDGEREVQVLRRYRYDAVGRLIESEGMSGHVRAFSYDEADRIITEREEGGYLWRFHYDALNRVTCTYGEDLHAWVELDYRPAAKSTRVKLWDGQSRVYVHDKAGRRVQLIDANGGVSERAYDDHGWLVKETDGEGNAITYERDEAGRLIKEQRPGGAVYTWRRDHRGDIIEAVDPCGATTRYTRDGRGNAIRVKHPDGRETRQRFNAQGQLIARLDPDGAEHRYRYEGGLLVEEIHDERREILRYDALKRLMAREVDEAITRYTYDPAWRIKGLEGPGGAHQWRYTPKGEIAAYTDPRGRTWRREVDDMDRIVARITPEGRQIKTTRGLNQHYSAHLDAEGRGWRYDYDGHDRLIRQRGPLGAVTRYERDRAGHLIAVHTDDGGGRRFKNDAAGRPTTISLKRGGQILYKRDPLGRITEAIEHPEGGATRQREGEPAMGERRAVMIRDALGRVTAEYGPHGLIKQRFGHDQLISVQRGALQLQIKHDPRGEIVAIQGPTGQWRRQAGALISPEGALRAPVGEGWRLHDARGRAGLYYGCLRDADGLVIEEGLADGERALWHHAYQRDEDGRLRDQYDAANNRLIDAAIFSDGQRLTRDAYGRVEHDAQGRVTLRHSAQGPQRLRWDDLDRLIEVEQPNGDVIRYTYDGLSRLTDRVEDPVLGPVTRWRFLWLENRLAGEIRPDGTALTYIYLSIEDFTPWAVHVEELTGGALYALHADARGAIIAASDEAGRARFLAEYSPYGEAKIRDRGLDVRLRLQGMWADPTTGLYLNRFRWYAPEWGRYLTPDPLGISGGFNAFTYAGNDPVSRVDPLGLSHNPKGSGGDEATNNVEPRHAVGTEPLAESDGLNKGHLKRLGAGPESVEKLATKAAEAEAHGFPHGVSVRLSHRPESPRSPHRSAPYRQVSEAFKVEQTGADPKHHTVHLPKPVDEDAAALFNRIFHPK